MQIYFIFFQGEIWNILNRCIQDSFHEIVKQLQLLLTGMHVKVGALSRGSMKFQGLQSCQCNCDRGFHFMGHVIDIVENSRDSIIKISDNGMGIPPQYIKSIFEKFFRVPQGDAQSIKGFGLGLYYVSSIVKKHSGNISVQSKQQSGTEFIITLPKNP